MNGLLDVVDCFKRKIGQASVGILGDGHRKSPDLASPNNNSLSSHRVRLKVGILSSASPQSTYFATAKAKLDSSVLGARLVVNSAISSLTKHTNPPRLTSAMTIRNLLIRVLARSLVAPGGTSGGRKLVPEIVPIRGQVNIRNGATSRLKQANGFRNY